MTKPGSPNRLTHKDAVLLAPLIDEALEPAPGGEPRAFKPGQTDKTVAEHATEKLGRPIEESSVAYLRRDIWGHLRQPPPSAASQRDARLADCEVRLGAVEAIVQRLLEGAR